MPRAPLRPLGQWAAFSVVLCGPQREGLGFPCVPCSPPLSPPLQGPGQLISLIEETTSTECQEVAPPCSSSSWSRTAKTSLDLLFQLELGRTCEAWEGVAC